MYRHAHFRGRTPEEFTAIVSNEYRTLWDRIGIQYDHFIRTTEPRHLETVRWLFNLCLESGYVYEGSYTGQYCVFDELYVNDAKPGDPCPDCGRPTETVTEENYFFKLSAFADRLLNVLSFLRATPSTPPVVLRTAACPKKRAQIFHKQHQSHLVHG